MTSTEQVGHLVENRIVALDDLVPTESENEPPMSAGLEIAGEVLPPCLLGGVPAPPVGAGPFHDQLRFDDLAVKPRADGGATISDLPAGTDMPCSRPIPA